MTNEEKRKITRRSAKQKGSNFQNWVAQNISKITGIPWGKDELIASREASQTGTDIRLIGDAKEIFPFACEAKRQEKWVIPEWIKQAKSNKGDFKTWLLFCKRNNEDPVVIMDAKEFFEMYELIINWDLGEDK